MNGDDIAQARLANQRLTETTFTTAAEVVAWLVAVQAQEYTGAKAALGLRARGLDDAAVERGQRSPLRVTQAWDDYSEEKRVSRKDAKNAKLGKSLSLAFLASLRETSFSPL